MSEDIVERLRQTGDDWPAALVALEREAADEIERLRADVEALKNGQEVAAVAIDAAAGVIKDMGQDLTEALRLMEPVAKGVKAQDDPRLPDTCAVLVPVGALRAIADFVTRMRGGTNE